ncbi:uncharacterized protein LOC109932449 isoform X2 [Rhincodon typus]|uniref:uncharacterized protein LOC109932449 isoform X2 n=1 Tax=Rhincodon typus TaxID=259920 RepID=UPI00202F9E13|nr:uncharacterized protein LOC109932449 isoform X2 [Rhincodon typus]
MQISQREKHLQNPQGLTTTKGFSTNAAASKKLKAATMPCLIRKRSDAVVWHLGGIKFRPTPAGCLSAERSFDFAGYARSKELLLPYRCGFSSSGQPHLGVGIPFPKNFLQICKKILCRLFRVFVHVYIHHFDRLGTMGAEAHVNTCYKHFYYFVTEFNLVDRKELEPLKEMTLRICH